MFARGVVLTILCRMRYVCQRSGSYNPLWYEVCLPEEWFLQSSVILGMFARGVVLTILCRMRYVCQRSGSYSRMRYVCQRSGSYNPLSYEVCLPEEWFLQSFVV